MPVLKFIPAALIVLLAAAFTGCSSSAKEQSYTVESDSSERFDPKPYNAFETQARQFATGMMEGDFDNVLKHYNPKAVEKAGGKDTVRKMMVLLYNYLKNNTKTVTVHAPEKLYRVGKALAGIAQSETVMTLEDGRIMKSVEYLLGTSEDNGNFWYFTDADPKTIKTILPEFNGEFVVPQKQEPYLTGK